MSGQQSIMDGPDLENRDPNSINSHLTIAFEDVLAEPESIHSIDCVWRLSYTCFNCWKNLCYKLHTLFYGICIAAELGCEFAYIAFVHIWYITPVLKMFDINCAIFKKMCTTCVGCCIEPCCEACGSVFKSFEKR